MIMSQWIPLTKLSDEASDETSVAIKCMPLFELIYWSISKYNATQESSVVIEGMCADAKVVCLTPSIS